jgi:hypothetical protein
VEKVKQTGSSAVCSFERGDQLWQLSIALDAAELGLGGQHPSRGPAQRHLSTAPGPSSLSEASKLLPDSLDAYRRHPYCSLNMPGRHLHEETKCLACLTSVPELEERLRATANGCDTSSRSGQRS